MRDCRVEFSSIDEFLSFWIDGAGYTQLSPEQQEVVSAYYCNYRGRFTPYIRGHYRNQVVEAEAIIAKLQGPRLLEIGCGLGTESLWFGLLGASVLGVDLSVERLSVAKARRQWLRAHQYDALDVEFRNQSILDNDDGPFDLIWMEQALHHLEPRDRVMQKVSELLKPGGYVVVSEANGYSPLMQAKLIAERGFNTVIEVTDANGQPLLYGNERILSPNALRRACSKVGIRPLTHRYFRCFPARGWAGRFAWVESAMPQWLPWVFTHYNFVGQKS